MSDNYQESLDSTEDEIGARNSEDRIADVYLGIAGGLEQRRRVRERIDWMHSQRAGERALDIGCSQGILPVLLARDGMTVTGVDINPNAIETARKLTAEEPAEIRNRIEFLVADACDPAFVSEQFDTVCVGEVVEHLQNPELLLQSAIGKLREGGVFILTTPHGYLPHDDHYQEFGLQELLDIVPADLSVDTIKTSNGYIYLKATKTAEDPASPSLNELLEISTNSLIEQQKMFYDQLDTRRDMIAKLQSEHDKVKSIAIRRRRELETATEKVASVTRIALRRRRELTELNNELDSVKQMESQGRRKISELESETLAASEKIIGLEEHLRQMTRRDDVLRARVKRRQLDIKAITTSSIYQTGLAIRLAFKKPLPNLFRLPLRLIKVAFGKQLTLADPYRDTILEQAHAANPVTIEPLPKVPQTRLSFTQQVRKFRDAGDLEGEYQFVLAEAEKKPTESVLRALYWASVKAGHVDVTFRTLRQIERLLGPSPTEEQSARLERLQRGPIMNLATLEAIPEPGVTPYTPKDDRVAYILHNSLPYSSGGYATRGHGLMVAATAIGMDPICITRPGYPIDLKPELSASDVKLEEEIDSVSYVRLLEPRYEGDLQLSEYADQAADALVELLVDKRPSCVIAASNYRTALPALVAARRLGVPFIYEVRGFWEITRISREPEFEQRPAFSIILRIESEVARLADHVLTLTSPMKDELVARGVSEDRITLAPNSCDIDAFTPRDRDTKLAASLEIPDHVPVIGYVGTFVQYEGLEHLTEACVLLKERGLEFRLLLVGNENASGLDRGPITEQILETAEKAGIADWLIMPGRVPHEDVASYYSLIDIAPFPRKPQPVTEMVSPMKPLEAMAMEKAVVVSSVRALEEMVDHGKTGLVFEKGSVASLADTLATLIDQPELRVSLGVASREWVCEQRTWTKTAAIVHDLVTTLTQPGEKPENLQAHETNISI